MSRIGVLAVLLALAGNAFALDKADEGVFALVHNDGHITQKIARLSHSDGRWHLAERNADGVWEDVTCEDACALVDTPPQQVAQFLHGTSLDGQSMECVHDQAFAFCSSRAGADAGSRTYYMLAFADGKVIPLKWVRLDPATLKPVATAQSGWIDMQGNRLPDTGTAKSRDGFSASVLITPDKDWQEKWNTPPETVPKFSTAKEVSLGGEIFILTFLANPKVDGQGMTDVACDFIVVRPDGSDSTRDLDMPCFKGKLLGDPTSVYLSAAVLKFVAEPADPRGEWSVAITVKDRLRGVEIPLRTAFVVR
ncbi:hypothetical protein [Lysobacter sp. GCM10012299]|uniref:hypothetical protein n=1 Tax=Lysobacter sp. GCM10012299 TaxID=3317333 RepID=UPI003616714D